MRINPRERAWLTGYEDYRHATTAGHKLLQTEPSDAYVNFAKCEEPKRDCTYPCPQGGDSGKSGISGGVVVSCQPRTFWRTEDDRVRCVYCRDVFSPSQNRRGQCQEAPDPMVVLIRRVSFMWCADSLLYHCMADAEGEYSEPCSCDSSDGRLLLRWLALLGLSLIAPCMCCYAPLRACHRCAVACHCCGAKHKAAS